MARIVNKFKRWYWRWRNSDPIKNCPVYKNEGCSHVDGLLCNFSNCSTYHEYIERMLSDDWEGDEEIFVPEEECSKPFNTPKILGCNEIVDKGPIPSKEVSWDEFIELCRQGENDNETDLSVNGDNPF